MAHQLFAKDVRVVCRISGKRASEKLGYQTADELRAALPGLSCWQAVRPYIGDALRASPGDAGRQAVGLQPLAHVFSKNTGRIWGALRRLEATYSTFRALWVINLKTGKTRWDREHHLLEAVQQRLDAQSTSMRQRRENSRASVWHDEGRMGATHFLTKTLPKVAAEMALSVLAYNLTRS